jgi:hypothetical protein
VEHGFLAALQVTIHVARRRRQRWKLHRPSSCSLGLSPCSLGLSATSLQYFSLRTNQLPATSQQYFFSQNKPALAISHEHAQSADRHGYCLICLCVAASAGVRVTVVPVHVWCSLLLFCHIRSWRHTRDYAVYLCEDRRRLFLLWRDMIRRVGSFVYAA